MAQPQLRLGDHARAQQVSNLLRISDVAFVPSHLSRLADAECGQRIDEDIGQAPLGEDVRDGFPEMPRRFERKHDPRRLPPLRLGAPNQLRQARSRMGDAKTRQTPTTGCQDDDLMSLAPQIESDCDIVWS
jgi:hypothetical protein